MTKEEVLEFITANPAFSLATIDGKQPRTRMIMLYRADEDGIIFSTGRDKDVNKQLQASPVIEMCFYSHEQNRQVRIEGKAEVINDLELKKQIVEDFSFLKPWIEAQGYDVLVTYRVPNGRATAWTVETNELPKEYVQL
ncbi:MAG: pyridoxamine 5'-phosphate oxidase family protein [Phycisphaerales bacterium]|nr:MAG: pyridoxamine 5'-phosphate oxidase family protein [Phycisphaerales bacterium]